MPKYNYTAVDLENNTLSDVVEAKNEKDLKRILRNQTLIPIKYKVLEEKQGAYRLKANETAEFSRQLGNMLSSGITAVRAIEIIKDRDLKPKLALVYQQLYKDILKGITLSEAMKMQGKVFPELLINMYASGEASGQLENVANKMAVHFEKEHRLNVKVKSAMTYPTILMVITAIVVMVLFTLILPVFFEMFTDIELPALTQAIAGMSKFLQSYWYIVLIAVLIIVAIFRYLNTIHAVALKFDYWKLKYPIVGKLLKIIYTARFSRTLSSLYSSGVSMLMTLEITSTIIMNKYIESQFVEVIKDVKNGESLSKAVSKVDGFEKKLSMTILVGEESGRLDAIMESIAESFDYDAEMATGRLIQLVEPIMIVILAVIIGTIMLSVMLPLMSLYQNAANM